MNEHWDDLKLYSHSNNKDLHWPLEAQYEHDYIFPFLLSESQEYVSNVQTGMHVLQMAGHLFPLTVNDAEYDNSYVCSPFTKYITYAQQELWVLNSKLLERPLSSLLSCVGLFLKAGKINQVACVNNWLLSTNLYPKWDVESVKNVTDFLVASFPEHTIMFPSLNRHTNAQLMDQLQKNGYQLVPSREVFIFDKALKDYTNRRVTEIDFDLLQKTPYQVVSHREITEKDYDRIVELYYLLYFKKYSTCSPQFSSKFIKLCHEKNLLNFQGLRKPNGDLVGIIASFNRNRILATPLVGYDTQLPLKDGLYRMLTALSIKEALEQGFIFNMSAGASEFKKWRGGVGFVEYNAVYHKHLPFYRRAAWNYLHFVMTQIGVPLLHKYRF